jgi:hypothetical protein
VEPGICKLCLQEKPLVDSHFLPSAAYKAQYASGYSVNEPMVMTSRVILQSSKQITNYAFCADCEDVFNKGGESWVVNKLATIESFPLRDRVNAIAPQIDEPGFKVFSAGTVPSFKIDKLVHFSLGIFWKSAACTWKILGTTVNTIDLGPYKEPIRQFLLGRESFPKHVGLVTYLDSNRPPLIAMTPPRRFRNESFHLFGFYINGMECLLCVGRGFQATHGDFCIASAPSNPIFLMSDVGNNFFDTMKPFTEKSHRARNLIRTLEEYKRKHSAS